MKRHPIPHFTPSLITALSRTLCAALGLALLAGCGAFTPRPDGGAYEYRYRVFESQSPSPNPVLAPQGDKQQLEKFMSPEALNQAMDALSQE